MKTSRRLFLKRCLSGCGAALLGGHAAHEIALGGQDPENGIGFPNDAPAELDRFSRPAAFWREAGALVRCELCPHRCLLREGDRGFCRARVVKSGALHTVAYGNLCTAALDPIEKKPLFHFLPTTPILSVAMGGCNLRCLNCQNADISQARPSDVARMAVFPEELIARAVEHEVPSIAYTYSEPLVSYEYVRDAALEARAKGIRNVLVTAGFIEPAPLRELCRAVDAVTLDVKGFSDALYRTLSGARLAPVLKALEVFREERVWTEVSFLMVPGYADSAEEVGRFARWIATHLGADTPLHLLRFRPAHKLRHLPYTPVQAMEAARESARDAGLVHVYVGNLPGADGTHTRCPDCGRLLIERHGYQVRLVELQDGRCPCGRSLAGVFK